MATTLLLPTTRLALAPSPDGFAFLTTVQVDATPHSLMLDTSSAGGVKLACAALASAGTNATACFTKTGFEICPANSTTSILWSVGVCKQTTLLRVALELGDLTVTSAPVAVLKSNMTELFHGADGVLGLAARSTYTSRDVNLTNQIQSYSMNLSGSDPYVLLNSDETLTKSWAALRQEPSLLNDSTVAVRGFSESVDEAFVTARVTQPSNGEVKSVDGWLDAAWPSIIFPSAHFNPFYTKYLTTCEPNNETSTTFETPRFYHCDRNVALPRLAFTTTNGTFFLDRADYVKADASDATRAIVLVQNYTFGKYSSIEWGLGQPFVRKFPAYFNGTGRRHQITLYCQSGVSCDLTKWSVNGSKYDDDSAGSSGSTTYRPSKGSSSSGSHTRYWTLVFTIPIFILIVLYSGRRLYREQKIERQRRRLLNEGTNEDDPASATPLDKTSDQPQQSGPVSTPTATATAPYSLLSGPATLTVNATSNGSVATTTATPAPATGVTARLRNDLADLETRL